MKPFMPFLCFGFTQLHLNFYLIFGDSGLRASHMMQSNELKAIIFQLFIIQATNFIHT